MLSLFAHVHQTAAYLVWSNIFTSSAHFSIRTLVFHCWPSEYHQLVTLSSMHPRAAFEGVIRCVPSVIFFFQNKKTFVKVGPICSLMPYTERTFWFHFLQQTIFFEKPACEKNAELKCDPAELGLATSGSEQTLPAIFAWLHACGNMSADWISACVLCPHSQLFLCLVERSQTLVLFTKIPDKYTQMRAVFPFPGYIWHYSDDKGDTDFSLWFESSSPHGSVCSPTLRPIGEPPLCAHLCNLRGEVRKNVDFSILSHICGGVDVFMKSSHEISPLLKR